MKEHFVYSKTNDRSSVLNFLKNNPKKRVLDVGYSAFNWSAEFVTHYIDVNPPQSIDPSKSFFKGDINMPFVWDEIQLDVEKNGKFDFAICTHTLEDIVNPYYVALMLEKYSKMGFVAVPSKYQESIRHEGNYRGYIHHRYIFNKEGNDFVAYPKLNFIDFDNRFDVLASKKTDNNSELQFFWTDSISLKVVNENFMGPTVQHVIGYYNNILND